MPEDDGDGVLTRKVGPLPLWGWIAGVGGGVLLLVWVGGRQGGQAPGWVGMGGVSEGGDTRQLAALQGALSDMDARTQEQIAAMQEANAEAIAGTQQQLSEWAAANSEWLQDLIAHDQEQDAALVGALGSQIGAYQDAVNATNAGYFQQLAELLKSYAPASAAPPTTGTGATNPLAGLPQWAQDKLASPYWQQKAYLFNVFLEPSGPYGEALSAFGRSDTSSGLNTAGYSQAAQNQLNSLIAAGQAVKNPLYPG
jgi:hypothetical protein